MNEILLNIWQQKSPILFSGNALQISFQTFLLDVQNDHVLIENRVKPAWIKQMLACTQWTLQANMIRFMTDEIRSNGQHFVFPLKENAMIEETRQSERFSFSTDECVVCEILNPFDMETRVTKTVMDMSATGVSLRTSFASNLFQPGVFLPEIRVLINGASYTQTSARVVYNRRLADLSGKLRYQVGIKFEGR